jgi:NTE family protein
MQWTGTMSALERIVTALTPKEQGGDLAVMLTGGGARASYQVGLLLGIAEHFPNLRFQIVTGVSAGAINAVFLAGRTGSLAEKARDLEEMWCQLECSNIWRFDWKRTIPFQSAITSIFPRRAVNKPPGVLDTAPLAELLYRILHTGPRQPIPGIAENIARGNLHAVAINTLDYSTGQSVRWTQGRQTDTFDGPNHRNVPAALTVEHILASCALPFVFPAIRIGSEWHGDGGIRLAAPLSPAVHLGARRIIAMSTGYQRTDAEASTPVVRGYPPAAQILGQLVNAIFLDVIDEDVARMERMTDIITKLDFRERDGLKPIDLLVLRPSEDLGKLASAYEKYLPRHMKLLTRALGAKQTESPDFVSMLMFEPRYTRELIDIGKADVDSRIGEIRAFLGDAVPQVVAL